MNFDDLIGLDIEEAKCILDKNNISYTIKETVGFKDKDLLLIPKVIKLSNKNNLLEIIVTYFSSPL